MVLIMNSSTNEEAAIHSAAEREIARPIACEILAAAASTKDGLLGAAEDLGHDCFGVAAEMALTAWEVCARKLGYPAGINRSDLYYEICAEAEALLQSGWNPGDSL